MTPRRLVLSEDASRDLDLISESQNEQASGTTARRVGAQFEDGLRKLASLGGFGASRSHLRNGLRIHIILAWNVYFEVAGDDLVVVRIIHGTRNVTSRTFRP